MKLFLIVSVLVISFHLGAYLLILRDMKTKTEHSSDLSTKKYSNYNSTVDVKYCSSCASFNMVWDIDNPSEIGEEEGYCLYPFRFEEYDLDEIPKDKIFPYKHSRDTCCNHKERILNYVW